MTFCRPSVWSGVLLVALSQLACIRDGDLKDINGPGSQLALVIAPGAVTVNVSDTARFSVIGRYPNGDTLVIAVNWSANGGTITPTGIFVSDTPGTFTVITAGQTEPLADTAIVQVIPAAQNLSRITITPSSFTTMIGSSTPMQVSGTLTDGSTVPVAVNWTTNGGVVDAGGTFTAGDSLGSFIIAATTTDGLFTDTANVIVQPTAPTLIGVALTPSVDSLQGGPNGETSQFTAIGSFNDGTSHPITAVWTASAGVVTSTGLYSAKNVAAGTYRVVAVAPNGLSDTARVVVTLPFVTRIELTPQSVTLTPGGTQAFTVTGFLSDGSTAAVSATFAATGGVIGPNGVYKAGNVAGTFNVIATSTAGGKVDTATVTINTPILTLTEVVISPAPVGMLGGETVQFTAEGIFSDQSRAPISVTYVVTGGTITGGGLYTSSLVSGTYRVIARSTAVTSLTDTVNVTVYSVSQLQSLSLNPPTVGIPVGGTAQFNTTGRITTGAPVLVNVTYSATGGSITPAGLYTAGGTTGSFSVTARHLATGITTTAAVTVGVSSCVNEPPGFTAITDQPWSAVPPASPAVDQFGWEVSAGRTRLSVINDPSARRSGPDILQGLFPTGMTGGGGPFHIERAMAPVKELYQCFWMKVASGFTNNGNVGTKLQFILNTYSGHTNSSQAYMNGFDKQTDVGNMGVNIEAPNVGGIYNREMPTRFKWSQHFDEWHQFEVLIIANSQATPDGILKIWVDGALDTFHSDVKWFVDTAIPTGFNLVDITPTYGGGHNPVPYPMYFFFDHWYISGR